MSIDSMEVFDSQGYNRMVGKIKQKRDGSCKLYDTSGKYIGRLSASNYIKMLFRASDRTYAYNTHAPYAHK